MSRLSRVIGGGALGLAVLGGIGYVFYRKQAARLEAVAHAELTSIGRLKVEQLQDWRAARRADAELLRSTPTLLTFVDTPEGHNRAHLDAVLAWVREHYARGGYDMVDIVAPGQRPPQWEGVEALVATARTGREVALSGLFRDEAGAVGLAVVSPIPRHDGRASGYVLLLRADPSVFLFRAIQTWPTPTASAETLLVRRDGDEVVYLNDLKFLPNAALRLRMPLIATLPAARAIAGATTEPGMRLRDYRGVPVLAAGFRVPDSDWAVVAKVDASELHGPLRRLMAWTWVSLGALWVAAVAIAMWLLERRDTAALRHVAVARDAEDRLALAVHAAGVGMWDWDVVHGRVYYSPEYRRQLGVDDSEPMDAIEHWEQRLHPDDRDRVLARSQQYASAPWPDFSQEFRLRHRDGSYRNILARAEGRFDAGRLVRMVGCHVDLTPVKQLEAQLRQAQKMEAVGRLAGGIAHDFNNVLTVINGYVELLLAQPSGPDVRADLLEVQRAGQSAARLTRRLLVFSRIDTTGLALTDINTLLREWQTLLARTLGDDIVLELDLAAGAAHVMVDATQLEQAIVNMAVNARDAMPGGGRLVLRTSRRPVTDPPPDCTSQFTPGDYWVLSVADSGTGIADAVLPHIFEPFFTTKGTAKGTGLGLTTVYAVAASAGGGACVATSEQGTTFSLFLPVAPAGVVEHREAGANAKAVTPRRVLVVDDNPDVRAVVARMLLDAGHTVESGDAATALTFEAQGRRFDVLVTDMVMPHVSGVELAARMKADNPTLPLVFMTGYVEPDMMEQLPATAVVLRKPVTPAALVRAIASVTRT